MNYNIQAVTERVNQLMSFTMRESLPEETWREIMIEDTCYFVSTLGRVLSLQRRKARLLKQWVQRDGYYYIEIKGIKRRVHRLVAQAFISNPEGKPIVHHKDGNRRNNKADNLQWTTTAEHAAIHKQSREKNNANT